MKFGLFLAILYFVAGALSAVQGTFYESPLLEPDWKAEEVFLPAPQGFAHPFSSFGKLGDAIIDAFRVGNPRYALLRYGHRDDKTDFGTELNFVAGYDQRVADSMSYGFIWKGVKLKSRLNSQLSANAFWWNGAFLGDKAAAEATSPLIDGYVSKTPSHMRIDNLNADLSYQNHWLKLSLARGRPSIGSNLSGSIVLSDRVNDFGYFEAEGRLGSVSFSLLHGSLVADSVKSASKMADLELPDKFLALHEIGWQITPRLKAFAGELVIYGNRSLDINYLMPHTFWRVVEHNQHDRDNVLIYTGLDGFAHQKIRLWLTLALDEFSYGKILGSWWGNKWAVQSGVALELPAFLAADETPRLSAEIVAVRPWTYTHYQNHTMYSHDGRSLGHPEGSNQLSAHLELDLPISQNFRFCGLASYKVQGDEGNDWQLNYNDFFADDYHAEAFWLQKNRTSTLQLGSLLKIRLAHIQMYLGQRAARATAWKHNLFAGLSFQY